MITALHIFLGVLTPHLGAIFTGVFSLLKARQDAKFRKEAEDDEVEKERLKAEEEDDRLEHKYQNWSDKLTPVIKLIVVIGVLSLFVWAEIEGNHWEDDFRQGMVSFVIAHAMSSGVLLTQKLKSK